jgi:hypothetical protein
VQGRLTRRRLLARSATGAAAAWLAANGRLAGALAAPPATAAEYWAFADRIQPLLDPRWSAQGGYYTSPGDGETSFNANLLLTHAAAAAAGHTGPSRQDERARILAARLLQAPPFRPGALIARDQTHDWGWGDRMDRPAFQHAVIDTAVARGLGNAYLARDALGLPPETADGIRAALGAAANGPFYTYPAVRLNQVNWPVEVHAWAYAATGDANRFRREAGAQLRLLADGLTHRMPGFEIPFTGPGYHWHYLPHRFAGAQMNLDSAEYGNIVCGALLFYERAVAAGMTPYSARRMRDVRAWVERVLAGYWTHAGYLNWDTGLSFGRWHQSKKLGLAQIALLAIAAVPSVQPSPDHGAWAKALFDAGLDLFARWMDEAGGLPPAVPFQVTKTPGYPADVLLAGARMQANAAWATLLGLGARAARTPPPLYAFDPDTGRLAISTPHYNTAVLPADRDALPYGGLELARLFDGRQEVAGGIGGSADAAFGVRVFEHATGRFYRSQKARIATDLEDPPLRLLRAPRGATRRPEAYPEHAYAGAFTTLVAEGARSERPLRLRTRHTFHKRFVETRWTIAPRTTTGRYTVELLFPSWGNEVSVHAALPAGRRVTIAEGEHPIRRVKWFHVEGERGGYVIVPTSELSGEAYLLHPAAQPSAPLAGPTLALRLTARETLVRQRHAARIAPARDRADAERVAARLAS